MTGSPVSEGSVTLHVNGSAADVWQELAQADSISDLLKSAHSMWCGLDCPRTTDCTFLHYPRATPAQAQAQTTRPRYNKDTAELFPLWGDAGYTPGVAQRHELNWWPLLEQAVARCELPNVGAQPYADFTHKDAASATEIVTYICRDSIQWTANWCGSLYRAHPTAIHYTAFSSSADDLRIPPLDLLSGRFSIYGHSGASMAAAMDEQGWGSDGVHAVLSLVREYIVQYAEKVDPRLYQTLTSAPGVWDATVFRGHTANAYGMALNLAHIQHSGPASFTWIMDSGICDCISMDLCKFALGIYHHDEFRPTRHSDHEQRRQRDYHSIYLDLLDDLVVTGAPEPLLQFAYAGFLFVPLQERYQERRTGRRLPLRPVIQQRLREVFGGTPQAPADPAPAWQLVSEHEPAVHGPAP